MLRFVPSLASKFRYGAIWILLALSRFYFLFLFFSFCLVVLRKSHDGLRIDQEQHPIPAGQIFLFPYIIYVTSLVV